MFSCDIVHLAILRRDHAEKFLVAKRIFRTASTTPAAINDNLSRGNAAAVRKYGREGEHRVARGERANRPGGERQLAGAANRVGLHRQGLRMVQQCE